MLFHYYDDIHNDAKLRVGVCHRVEGKNPTNLYFTLLANICQSKIIITELSNVEGQMLTSIEEILEKALQLCSHFFAPRTMSTLLHPSQPPKLNPLSTLLPTTLSTAKKDRLEQLILEKNVSSHSLNYLMVKHLVWMTSLLRFSRLFGQT